MKGVYLENWTLRRAQKAQEWTERYLLGSCGSVTVTPAWKVEREKRVAEMTTPRLVRFRERLQGR